jgi:hypothetical protein
VAFRLYEEHAPPLGDSLRREAHRYPSSLRIAVLLDVSTAAEVGRARRRRVGSPAHWRILVPEHAVELARSGRWYMCATCGRRLVGRPLVRAARRGRRERHTLWVREVASELAAG